MIEMTMFKTIDDSGAESVHECDNVEQAKQAHLLHYGLLSVNFTVIMKTTNLRNVCREKHCESLIEEMRTDGFGKDGVS